MKKPKTFMGWQKPTNTNSSSQFFYSIKYSNYVIYLDNTTGRFWRINLNNYNEGIADTYGTIDTARPTTITGLTSIDGLEYQDISNNGASPNDYLIYFIQRNATALRIYIYRDNNGTLSLNKDNTVISSTPGRTTFKVLNIVYSVYKISTTAANNYIYRITYTQGQVGAPTFTKISLANPNSQTISTAEIEYAIADETNQRLFFIANDRVHCCTYTLTGSDISGITIIRTFAGPSQNVRNPFIYNNNLYAIYANLTIYVADYSSGSTPTNYILNLTIPSAITYTSEEIYHSYNTNYINPTFTLTTLSLGDIVQVNGTLYVGGYDTVSNRSVYLQISNNFLSKTSSYSLTSSDILYIIRAPPPLIGTGEQIRALIYDNINNIIIGGYLNQGFSSTENGFVYLKINNRQ